MAFGLSGSKSKSTSTSSANSIAEQFGTSSSISGGFSGSQSTSQGGSQSTGLSQDKLAFEELYAQLYGGAAGVAGGLAQNPFLSDTANQLFGSGQNILAGLNGGDAGSKYLNDILTSNGNVDEQISLLGRDVSKFLDEGALPSIRRSAGGAGQLGGTRQGVAELGALQSATDSFATGAASIRTAEQQRKLAAAGQLQNYNISAAQTGLAGLTQQYDLANQGFLSQLSPYAALSGIFGEKTTLGSSLSQSSSFDEALASAFGEDFSASQASNYGYDVSQATSKSKSKSGSFGIGF